MTYAAFGLIRLFAGMLEKLLNKYSKRDILVEPRTLERKQCHLRSMQVVPNIVGHDRIWTFGLVFPLDSGDQPVRLKPSNFPFIVHGFIYIYKNLRLKNRR